MNKSANLRPEIEKRGIKIRHQGKRGTCSVHVMVFLMEYQLSGRLGEKVNHLSVEYANHAANLIINAQEDGQYFSSVAAGYDEYGIVPDTLWIYVKERQYDFDEACKVMNEELIACGREMLKHELRLNGRFVKQWGEAGLTDAQFSEIIELLDAGVPIGIGRDHSMALIGYERDEDQPGGGIFTFRNSHGTREDFDGYQMETFEHVKNTVLDAYVYTL